MDQNLDESARIRNGLGMLVMRPMSDMGSVGLHVCSSILPSTRLPLQQISCLRRLGSLELLPLELDVEIFLALD